MKKEEKEEEVRDLLIARLGGRKKTMKLRAVKVGDMLVAYDFLGERKRVKITAIEDDAKSIRTRTGKEQEQWVLTYLPGVYSAVGNRYGHPTYVVLAESYDQLKCVAQARAEIRMALAEDDDALALHLAECIRAYRAGGR